MRSHDVLIAESELMSSTSNEVHRFLKRAAGRERSSILDDGIDENLYMALLSRDDPRIDISLARYSPFKGVCLRIWEKHQKNEQPDTGYRCAILSNHAVAKGFFNEFPVFLFGSISKTIEWINRGDETELFALFSNPALESSFLREVIERKGEWANISDDRLWRIVTVLGSNSRMSTPYDDSWLDGYSDYLYHSVFDAAWQLAEKVPTTPQWAAALWVLYDKLIVRPYALKDPLEVIKRWKPDSKDADSVDRVQYGYLGGYGGVRKGLARLLARKNYKKQAEWLDHDDPAFRCVAYEFYGLTYEQMRVAFEKDGELAFNSLLSNDASWRTRKTRDILREMAWELVRADDNSDLLPVNLYSSRRRKYEEKHNEWFQDEMDDAGDEFEEVEAEATSPALTTETELQKIVDGVGHLSTQIRYMWWAVGGLLLLSLRHC